MRAFQGQFSDNVAIRRTVQEKERLVRELEQALGTSKSKPLLAQISSRIRELREEIRADRREEAVKVEAAAARAAVRQMDVDRRPRRQNLMDAANAALGEGPR